MPSAADFESALRRIRMPRGRQLLFLQAHYDARGRGLNAGKLAKAARYKSYRAINLHYGLLAARVARELRSVEASSCWLTPLFPSRPLTKSGFS